MEEDEVGLEEGELGMALDLLLWGTLFWGALFIGGGITLMAVVGIIWGVVEDWRRERRWNRG